MTHTALAVANMVAKAAGRQPFSRPERWGISVGHGLVASGEVPTE